MMAGGHNYKQTRDSLDTISFTETNSIIKTPSYNNSQADYNDIVVGISDRMTVHYTVIMSPY